MAKGNSGGSSQRGSSNGSNKGGNKYVTQAELDRQRKADQQAKLKRDYNTATRNTDADRRLGYMWDQVEAKKAAKEARQATKQDQTTGRGGKDGVRITPEGYEISWVKEKTPKFTADGTPANAYTQGLLDKAAFLNGKGYGAEAAILMRAGFKPPPGFTNVTPPPGVVPPVVTPAAPVPLPAPIPDTVPFGTVPVTTVSPQPVVDQNTFNNPVARRAVPVVDVPAARMPTFNPAGSGAMPYQKQGAAMIAATPKINPFPTVKDKGSNRQTLGALGERADFGNSLGGSYAKNKKDGLF